ncbi:hypothetical protein CCP3SC1AL1_1990004 [Gammaproteobacteria bacterium]
MVMVLSGIINRHLNNHVLYKQIKGGNEDNVIELYNNDSKLTLNRRIRWNVTLYDLAVKHKMYNLLEILNKEKVLDDK